MDWSPVGTEDPNIDGDAQALALALSAAEAHAPRRLRRFRVLVHRAVAPAEVECTLFTGQRIRVVLPEIVGTELYRRGFIEAALTRVLLEVLRPGAVFVDIGAHYGYHTLVASLLVGPAGAVHAFEPGRAVLPLLHANVAGTGAGNVTIHEVAASNADGTVELHDFGRVHSALSTVFAAARVPAAERLRLRARTYPVRRVDTGGYLSAGGIRPDFVKLDAEGAEFDILAGLRPVLEEHGPMLAVEAGDYEGMPSPGTAACIDFLESLGYQTFEYAGGLRPHIRRARYGYDNLYFLRG